jgi:hypothetical protein
VANPPPEDDDDIVHHANIEVQENNQPNNPPALHHSQTRGVQQSPHQNQLRDRAGSPGEISRPAMGVQPAQAAPPQQRGQMADDELFNSNIFNNGNENGQNDDFDFDFESSADDDNANRQSGGR